MAEEARKRREGDEQEAGGEDRQGLLEPPPAALDAVDRGTQREEQEAGVACGLQEAGGDVLGEERRRPLLQPSVEYECLPGVEEDDVGEEAPGHWPGPDPDQPGRPEHDGDARRLLQQENDAEQPVARPWLGREGDGSGRTLFVGAEGEGDLPAGKQVIHPAPERERRSAELVADLGAAHPLRIDPVAGAQAGPPGGRLGLRFEGPLHIEHQAIGVAGEPERAERTHGAQEVGRDHRDRVERQKHEDQAAAEPRAIAAGAPTLV